MTHDDQTPTKPHPDLPPWDSPLLAHITPDLRAIARPTAEVIKDVANLRVHTPESQKELRASYSEFKQRKNVVVQLRQDGTRVVRAGNGTLEALLALGHDWIAAAFVEESDLEATRFAISDNRTAEVSHWDLPALHTTLTALDCSVPGVTEDFMKELTDQVALDADGSSGPEDPGAEAPPENPVSKRGEVYQLGPHRLMCGDSTVEEDVKILLSGIVVHMVWTDPPYGIDYSSKNEFLNAYDKGNRNQRAIANDANPEGAWKVARDALLLAKDKLIPGGVFYAATGFGGDVLGATVRAIEESGLLPKWVLVWVKDNHVLSRADYLPLHENIVYGWKPGAGHYFSGHYRKTVFQIPRPKKSEDHPTMKPVELIEPMIHNSSKKDWVVFDPFTGSGSTLIACARTGRRFVGMEFEPCYADVCRRRWGEWARSKGEDPGEDAL